VGLTLAAHGTQKLFGWFGGPGLNATGQFFTVLSFIAGVVGPMLKAGVRAHTISPGS